MSSRSPGSVARVAVARRNGPREGMATEGRELAAIYDAMACGVVVRDAAGAVVFANAAAHRIFGRPPEQLAGTEPPGGERRLREDGTIMPDEEVPNVAAQRFGEPIRNVMMGLARSDGYVRWLLVDAVPIKNQDGSVREVVSSFTDVTDRKKAEYELERQSFHDRLTELPNRTLLLDRLEQGIRTARRLTTSLALLVMDLDRFKDVNDSFGHRAGDLLLRDVAARVAADLRDTDTVARLGGDEFAVVLPGAGREGAGHVAQKIIGALQRPFEIEGSAHEIGVSIGIALYPRHGEDVETLLRRAEIAMYIAKRAPGGAAVYADQDDQDGADELALIADLRRGLDHDELTVAYQPIVRMKSSEVTCLEALARWRHPKRGMVAPLEFVPLAERTGLVVPLFARVLETSLAQCGVWHEQGLGLEVAVNLSVRNLLDPDLPRIVARRLEAANARPEWLALEVTETMVMADPVRAIRALEQLVSLGVQLAIDDFGVGYSSLSYLEQLPAHSVKIDRSFIGVVSRDKNKESIVSLVIELGHSLGMTVVAEGVEDQSTWNALSALRCDAAQGFFVARPMSAEAIVPWMARANTATSGA